MKNSQRGTSGTKWTRRRFLKVAAGSTVGCGLVALGYAWRIEPHWVEVVRRQLPVVRLPESLVGKTLVQISDLHVGPVVDEEYITRMVERVSALDADILAVTGDFITYRDRSQLDQVARVLQHLRPGRLATVGILGNHDYGPGWSNVKLADELDDRLQELGIDVLRNESREVQGLQIVGFDDLWSPRFDPTKAMATLEEDRAAIVLCHNPDAADRPIWSGYQGWILSGHTHGGQCKFPLVGPPFLPVANRRYTAGEFDLDDGLRMYINRGLGYLRRIRWGVRPEITVFTLRRLA